MLKINSFIWDVYKESSFGKTALEMFTASSRHDFSPEDALQMLKAFNPEFLSNVDEDRVFNLLYYVWEDALPMYLFSDINLSNCRQKAVEIFERLGFDDCLTEFPAITIRLHSLFPEYFIPYLFLFRFNYFQQIQSDYDFDMEGIPGKGSQKRCLYYLTICDCLYSFRKLNNLSPAELCAFLYDMERRSFDSRYAVEATTFPKIWLICGSKNRTEASRDTMLWQANSDTKKGDILVFFETGGTYDKGKRSAITGIWTATSDGIADPFFWYYGQSFIEKIADVKPIPFKTLFNDPRTQGLPRLKANFCGASGDPIPIKSYNGLLELIEEWDPTFDRGILPIIKEPYKAKVRFEDRGDMKPEKWVEEYLVKEMLEQMGWGRVDVDYRRQVHLQMGRPKEEGEKVQDGKTDFSLFPFGKGLKKADVLIEVKAPGEMDGKEIEKTFWQAESYASRQYSGLIILADGNKVLLFKRGKDGTFSYSDTPIKFLWDEIFGNIEKFNELRSLIAPFRKHSFR